MELITISLAVIVVWLVIISLLLVKAYGSISAIKSWIKREEMGIRISWVDEHMDSRYAYLSPEYIVNKLLSHLKIQIKHETKDEWVVEREPKFTKEQIEEKRNRQGATLSGFQQQAMGNQFGRGLF